jgi:hypothetical protein
MAQRNSQARQGSLSLDDVRQSGQLAFFRVFGENLIYLHGTVYSLPSTDDNQDVEQLVRHPDAYPVTSCTGIEFGWYHLEGCDCDLCRRSHSGKSLKLGISGRVS